MFKEAIFDLDGVIVDSEPIYMKVENGVYKMIGINVPLEKHMKFVGATGEYMWSHLVKEYNLSYSVEELCDIVKKNYYHFITHNVNGVIPIKGVSEFIKDLYDNGIELSVASSSPLNVIEYVIQKLNLDKYFKEIITGDYVEKSKPEPDVFLYALRKVNKEANECVIVEDSHNGVLAANRAGIKVIGFRNPNSGNQDLSSADMIIDSFNDINYEKVKQLF